MKQRANYSVLVCATLTLALIAIGAVAHPARAASPGWNAREQASTGAWGLGNGALGRLGTGSTHGSLEPVRLAGQLASGAASVAATNVGGLAATSAGKVLTWGSNAYGLLGLGGGFPESGGPRFRSTPTPALTPGEEDVVMVAGGAQHALSMSADGDVYAWGSNASGQLGTSEYGPKPTAAYPENASDKPLRVAMPPTAGGARYVAAGGDASFAIDAQGRLWAWGSNNVGQLSGSVPLGNVILPTLVEAPPGFRAIKVVTNGSTHLAVSADGDLLAWGMNPDGCFGSGPSTPLVDSPTLLPVDDVVDVAVTDGTCLLVLRDGSMRAAGRGALGQLGNGSFSNSAEWVVPSFPKNVRVQNVYGGGYGVIAIAQGGRAFSWGADVAGKLGTSSFRVWAAPVPSLRRLGLVPLEVAIGPSHTIILTSSLAPKGSRR